MGLNIKRIAVILMASVVVFTACKGPPSEKTGMEDPAASLKHTITVLNPQGHVKKNKVLAPRLDTLEGKKIAMWLTATPDQLYAGKGAELYDILERMLKEKYSGIQIIRYADLPMKFMPENEVVDAIVKAGPDAVVAGFGG
ncbi:MAG: hypothetical protein JXL81_12075 [Deltaproteobacteria bacterium]|nr:hypothetical protein [Deltaproteobacteria bacterium]